MAMQSRRRRNFVAPLIDIFDRAREVETLVTASQAANVRESAFKGAPKFCKRIFSGRRLDVGRLPGLW